jgi:hypothetical protein
MNDSCLLCAIFPKIPINRNEFIKSINGFDHDHLSKMWLSVANFFFKSIYLHIGEKFNRDLQFRVYDFRSFPLSQLFSASTSPKTTFKTVFTSHFDHEIKKSNHKAIYRRIDYSVTFNFHLFGPAQISNCWPQERVPKKNKKSKRRDIHIGLKRKMLITQRNSTNDVLKKKLAFMAHIRAPLDDQEKYT